MKNLKIFEKKMGDEAEVVKRELQIAWYSQTASPFWLKFWFYISWVVSFQIFKENSILIIWIRCTLLSLWSLHIAQHWKFRIMFTTFNHALTNTADRENCFNPVQRLKQLFWLY